MSFIHAILPYSTWTVSKKAFCFNGKKQGRLYIFSKGYLREVNTEEVNDFIRTLPFELTSDQDKAIEDIYKDNDNLKEELKKKKKI